jgi:hypothetical protein
LQEVVENNKDYYNVVTKRNNLQTLLDYAFSDSQNGFSQNAAISVLVTLVQIYHEKKKDQEKKRG